jgi:hypothetical protein
LSAKVRQEFDQGMLAEGLVDDEDTRLSAAQPFGGRWQIEYGTSDAETPAIQ